MGLFDGRVAIITGSGQGIGHDLAVYMASEGCRIITNNRKKGSTMQAHDGKIVKLTAEDQAAIQKIMGDAESTAEEIIKAGGSAIPVYGDVANPDDCRRMVEAAAGAWGRVDIIVNNAASHWAGNIKDMQIDIWDKCIQSKLSGSFYLLHYALPYMIKQHYGRVINVASNAFIGLQGFAAYSAACSGIWAFTKAIAQDLAEFGIKANAITPLAATRSWYNTRSEYTAQGIPLAYIEAGAPNGMKTPPKFMVPAIAYLAAEELPISGLMMKVEADGQLAVYSESQEYNNCGKDCLADGAWTVEELREVFSQDKLLKNVTTVTTNLAVTE